MPGHLRHFLWAQGLPQMRDKTRAYLFYHVEHLFESGRTAEVRIRDFTAGIVFIEIAIQLQLSGMLRRTLCFKQRKIAPIHGHHVIKMFEVVFADLASSQIAHVETPTASCDLGAAVWRLSYVIVVSARRVALNDLR